MGTGRSNLPKGVKNITESAVKILDPEKLKTFRNLLLQDAGKYYSDLFTKYSDDKLLSLGLNTTGLQRILHELDLHDKGVVLPDDDFDRQIKTEALDNVELYRGADKAAIDNIMYGDLQYIGNGIHGDGIYLATNKETAKSYGRVRMTSYIDKSLAKVVKENILREQLRTESSEIRQMFRGNTGLSVYALYKGYNVIHAPGGNGSRSYKDGGEDYYVPLVRSVLVMREHTNVR